MAESMRVAALRDAAALLRKAASDADRAADGVVLLSEAEALWPRAVQLFIMSSLGNASAAAQLVVKAVGAEEKKPN